MNLAARRMLPLPAALALACALGAAAPAQAQRYDDDHHGLYFAGGLGGGLQLPSDGSGGAFGGQGELRLGYSFGRRFQIYLDGDVGFGSHSVTNPGFGSTSYTILASDVMVGLRYFLYSDHNVGVYGRAGLGLGIVSVSVDGATTQYGIAETYALGMEFRLGGKWSLSPELFYRRTNETQDSRVDSLGLGVLVNFN